MDQPQKAFAACTIWVMLIRLSILLEILVESRQRLAEKKNGREKESLLFLKCSDF